MAFLTDKQTLEDLNIFGRQGQDSIFAIFNRCDTRGGATILETMFRYPLSDAAEINQRAGIISYFAAFQSGYPFRTVVFDAVQIYMDNTDTRTKLAAEDDTVAKKVTHALAGDLMTAQIKSGIAGIAELAEMTRHFISGLQLEPGHPFEAVVNEVRKLLSDPVFAGLPENKGGLSFTALVKFDELLRFRNRGAVNKLLDLLYHLDVYMAAGRVARERGFSFPEALPADDRPVTINGLYHPGLAHAVPNDIRITSEGNVIFLTGANMAGKSTFMKSLSIALYLAHMGFPVACVNMSFVVLDGIYTTINLPDDLGMGASHFYAEVLRVKKISSELKTRRLFVVFDEMFRGTNVKDAAEATIAFTQAFARNSNSIFVISTHIVEAGDVLQQSCPDIKFLFLPTLMNGTKPVYTYKLEQGITEDRHGMIIINNERILEILDKGMAADQDLTETPEQRSFMTDQQTLQDLNLLGKYKPHSVYGLFNKACTRGGERLLEQMFNQPLVEAAQINARSRLFRFFMALNLPFPISGEVFTKAEAYLNAGTAGNYPMALTGLLVKKFQQAFLRDPEYSLVHEGLTAAIELLNACSDLTTQLAGQVKDDNPYKKELQRLQKVFADPRLQWIRAERGTPHIPLKRLTAYDYLLKNALRQQMETVLECLYRLDVYISVGLVAKERGLQYAEALPREANFLETSALWHPSLLNGTANPVSLNGDGNMIFLTGANMAGKSTLMKALGTAVYLAHMGFPVAAKDMQFSVRDGLLSSINVHDDLNMGYSHFYAEVLRVKKVAEEVSAGKNLVVLFDELFKGTNVKDAYDGTLSVTAAFSRYRKCFYIVSTHIIEVGETLRQKGDHIRFAYLPTLMDGKTPRYTYQLKEGITADRQGMMIIENEGILDML